MVYVGHACYTPCLSHHGILGMKWGVRRYQNKDGTLTAAGKRRVKKLETIQQRNVTKQKKTEDKKEKAIGVNKSQEQKSAFSSSSKESSTPPKKKSVMEMTEAELRSEVNRLGLIKQYNQYMRELNTTPKKTSAGKEAVKKMLSTSLMNVGTNVSTNVIGVNVNKFGRAIGLDYDLYTKEQKKK